MQHRRILRPITPHIMLALVRTSGMNACGSKDVCRIWLKLHVQQRQGIGTNFWPKNAIKSIGEDGNQRICLLDPDVRRRLLVPDWNNEIWSILKRSDDPLETGQQTKVYTSQGVNQRGQHSADSSSWAQVANICFEIETSAVRAGMGLMVQRMSKRMIDLIKRCNLES